MKQYITAKKIADHGGKEKTPTHLLEVKNEGQEKGFTAGKFWTKESQYGKYLAGQLSDDYTDKDGKFYDGYVIITKKEYANLLKNKPTEIKTGGYDGDIFDGSVIDDSKIEF